MRYVDFVEAVLRIVIDHGTGPFMFGMAGIGERLGLDVGN